jgi:asparagine synthase (glutamine-hydrolysing)
MAAAGHIRTALREVLEWCIQERQSFWKMTNHEVIRPLLPFGRSTPAPTGPAWLQPLLTRSRSRLNDERSSNADRFGHSTATAIVGLPAVFERWPGGSDIEVRYPFLYRPLVEFSLGLPARERIRPEGRKWILREAMRGTLPEKVRTRNSKGGIDARILWSLTRERSRIDAMLRQPVLGELGCVDAARLRMAVDEAARGVPGGLGSLFRTLSLETWLAAWAGRNAGAQEAAQTAA